ncbi:phytoene/squalene synthase family protein [Natronobacterium gregoryi]|uniref:Phytoene/squalene synthetase n=2 Tax=Natronobacterium gregoryi TaxID=44930 RepID=L0AE33_NATGS|nr:phytoene/squalene synthase family protein [Natronobacterium gregoryi]AFZ71320.1 phytoene/squalene synthetase [Natronobacterium gregoryi SP2]ELY67209.1 Squalene/phytoene synthase [Natronobacterium gregoryi SP2]PLK19190.1 squalene/phytoene synthase family protein [Natronobacterium gregoryi SP2]SFJ59041.1 farnesyl-diphosphate farnesyltransferase [Natronobacterium gregoryi]
MTSGQPEYETDADLEWCYDAVHGVSRTFAITIDRLEEPMARHICLGYLLCRIADTIEDAGHIPPETQTELLVTYDRVLDPDTDLSVSTFMDDVSPWIPENCDDDWDVVAETPRVLRTFESLNEEPREIMREPVRELVDGMAMFTDRYADEGGLRLQTVDELEEYCWYAAGTVGTLITGLVARGASEDRAQEMRNNARSFALLLQLVNIAKDVENDYHEENNVYLPAEWLEEEDVPVEAVTDEENHGAVTNVIQRVTNRAETYVDDAHRYLEAVPERHGNRLSAWAIPYLLAVGTMRELRERPEDVVQEGDVKVSRAEVYALIQQFEDGISESRLDDLRQAIAEEPLHR